MDFNIRITTLTSPFGSHATFAYGETEDGGLVELHQENQWFSVRYMAPHEFIPSTDALVYYVQDRDFDLFCADVPDIEAYTPSYIKFTDGASEDVSVEKRSTLEGIWNGTQFGEGPRVDPFESFNISGLFIDTPEVSDELWSKKVRYDALVDAATQGYESESIVREIVGDEYFEVAQNGILKKKLEVLQTKNASEQST